MTTLFASSTSRPFSAPPHAPRLITVVCLGLLLCAMAFLAGCQGQSPKQVAVYFAKAAPEVKASPNNPDTAPLAEAVISAVRRELPEQTQTLNFAIKQLLTGPTPAEKVQGLYSEIPAGTKLLRLVQKNNQVTVDLTPMFVSGGGASSIQTRLNQVQKTVQANTSPKTKVSITINGQPMEYYGGEGLEFPMVADEGN
jgi:hypothetical protein